MDKLTEFMSGKTQTPISGKNTDDPTSGSNALELLQMVKGKKKKPPSDTAKPPTTRIKTMLTGSDTLG